MARINVSITEEFRQAVVTYSKGRGLTESAALVELAALGLLQATREKPESIMLTHGGGKKRRTVPLPQHKGTDEDKEHE